jgi:hypothetical protein
MDTRFAVSFASNSSCCAYFISGPRLSVPVSHSVCFSPLVIVRCPPYLCLLTAALCFVPARSSHSLLAIYRNIKTLLFPSDTTNNGWKMYGSGIPTYQALPTPFLWYCFQSFRLGSFGLLVVASLFLSLLLSPLFTSFLSFFSNYYICCFLSSLFHL